MGPKSLYSTTYLVFNYKKFYTHPLSWQIVNLQTSTKVSPLPACFCRLVTLCQRLRFVFSERELTFTFAICCRPSVCLSSVCNTPALYSGGCNFPKYFYGILYIGHPLTSTENFMEIVPGEPLRRELNTRGVAKYSDFGPIEGYMSETVQDKR